MKQAWLEQRARFFGVMAHVLTATGAAWGLLALQAAIEGRLAWCFVWLGVALVVDGLDGLVARAARVDETAAFIDGALLDLIVDFLTYVLVPVVILLRIDLVPAGWALPLSLAVMTATALYFADTRMKTADLWFRGFPGTWNALIFTLLAFRPPQIVSIIVIVLCLALMFAPVRFVHPFRVQRWRGLTLLMTCLWGVCAALVLRADFAAGFATLAGLAVTSLYFVGLGLLPSDDDGTTTGI